MAPAVEEGVTFMHEYLIFFLSFSCDRLLSRKVAADWFSCRDIIGVCTVRN